MRIYVFIGLCLIFGGLLVLIRGGAAWGLIQVENLSGAQSYLASIPVILLGMYILYNSWKSGKIE